MKQKETRLKEKDPVVDIRMIILIFLICFLLLPTLNWITGYWTTCNLHSVFSSDKYCQINYYSNFSGSGSYYELRSHKADFLAEQERQVIEKERKENEIKEKQCYDNGYDYHRDLDIIKDYGLSCQKIAYINDHLIDEKVNGGYIKGSYSGFFSSGHIEGNFDIMKDSLATGQLVQNISYHVNCRNETTNEEIDYYDESEFVLYYVDRCLN